MELKFENQGTSWVAEFEVTGDFNLHVERVSGGRFLLHQKTVKDGKYAICDGVGRQDHKDVIETTLFDLVYPKWIKVVSKSEVTRAVVLPEGVATPVAKLIEFYCEGGTYQAEEGMTWQQFIESEYNNGDFSIAGNNTVRWKGSMIEHHGTIYSTDVIEDGGTYMQMPM